MQPNDELNGLIKKAKRQKCIIAALPVYRALHYENL